jgi:hypothetical protein
MAQVIELSDAEYPLIYSGDGRGVPSGATPGEKSFFLFKIQVDSQSQAKKIQARIVASVDAGSEMLMVYVWNNPNAGNAYSGQWVRMGEASVSTDPTEFLGSLAFQASYVSAAGICYLLLTSFHFGVAINLDYIATPKWKLVSSK